MLGKRVGTQRVIFHPLVCGMVPFGKHSFVKWRESLRREIIEKIATSRLSYVSIETCADEVDFQVDLRLT